WPGDPLHANLAADPLTQARLEHALGVGLLGLGEPAKAAIHLHRSFVTRQAELGPDHPDTLVTMRKLAQAYQDDRNFHQALPLFEEVIKKQRAKLGLDHHDTLDTMRDLAWAYQHAGKHDQAVILFTEIRDRRMAKYPGDTSLPGSRDLALAYQDAGKF